MRRHSLSQRRTARPRAADDRSAYRRTRPGVSRLLVVLVRDHRLDAQELEPVADAFDAVTRRRPAWAWRARALAEAINLAMIGSRRVDSCTRPAVTSTANGVPRPSVTSGTGRNPPRLRPNAWSLGSSGCHWRLLLELFNRRGRARAARTLAPSTHHRSQSIRPCLSSLSCNASTIRARPRPFATGGKWSYTVCHGPKRVGRSRQGAPVQRIHKMPSSIRRGSEGVRPVVAVRFGNRVPDGRPLLVRELVSVHPRRSPSISFPRNWDDQQGSAFSDRA